MDNREKGYTLYKKGLKYKEIAEKLGVPESTVKSWATRYWKKDADATKKVATKKKKVATEDATDKPNRRGAPIGNVNAVGNKGGAPLGNTNGLKHGGYARITLESLSEDEVAFLEECGAVDDEEVMLQHEIGLLTIRITRLLKILNNPKYETKSGMYVETASTSETKRRFANEDEKAAYQEAIQKEIDSGTRKPGESYTVHTVSRNSDEFFLSVQEALNRAQALRQKCIESLAKLRAEKQENNPQTDLEDTQELREAIFGVHTE